MEHGGMVVSDDSMRYDDAITLLSEGFFNDGVDIVQQVCYDRSISTLHRGSSENMKAM